MYKLIVEQNCNVVEFKLGNLPDTLDLVAELSEKATMPTSFCIDPVRENTVKKEDEPC